MRSRRLTSWSVCAIGLASIAGADTAPVVAPSGALVADTGEAYDALGSSMAAEDGIVLIGCRGDDSVGHNSGAVYCFQVGPNGYQQTQKITPASTELSAQYGHAIALDGTRALVGVPLAEGVAVLEFNGTNWVETSQLLATTEDGESTFGDAVALDGDWIAVGSPGTTEDTGSVEVYELVKGQWQFAETIVPPAGTSNDRFGSSLVLDGNRLLVGSPFEDSAAPDAGAVFVYEHSTTGWALVQTILPTNAGSQEYFGRAIALEDEVLIVGAYRRDEVAIDSGAVFVYRDTAGTFVLETTLSDPADAEGSEFGDSVAITDSRIVVGGPGDQSRGVGAGAMWTFTYTGSDWTPESRIESSLSGAYEFLGSSVCLDGDVVFGGAPLASLAAEYAGAAYVLDLSIDCDGDAIPDVLAIAQGQAVDCNLNGIPDSCDIAAGTEDDQDQNGIPDSCFFDCNENGVNDADEILENPNRDRNLNGILDSCECLSDLLPDGIVDGGDLGLFLVIMGRPCGEGTSNPDCDGDLDGNAMVDGADLGLLLSSWGPCS